MKYNFLTAKEIEPTGWLRRQLEIQAASLAGNLDLIWPDVSESRWIGGKREGWERVPYWLDGFIPLAYLLRNEAMIHRAQRYVEAILSKQCDDGWICPCSQEERAKYDMWALLLLSKVLCVYADCSGDDERVDAVLRRAMRQFSGHLDAHPLFDWGKFRWFEGLIAIDWLRRRRPESWLEELAMKLQAQGYDYAGACDNWSWRGKESTWTFEAHVVNQSMAIKAGALMNLFRSDPRQAAQPKRLLELLREYHGMVHGHFTGDECLAGLSPIQGTELCGVVEAMYSEELLLAISGEPCWGDWLERLAYNALPATCSEDMWTHQYDQQANQIGCVMEKQQIFGTNSPGSHMFGLEPNYGCCTANMGQGWPKFALSTFMRGQNGLFSGVLAPSKATMELNGVKVRCTLETDYPFSDRLTYVIEPESPVDFDLDIRIPGFADGASVDGKPVKTGAIYHVRRHWEGRSTVEVRLDFIPRLVERPYGLHAVTRGPLVFALPISSERKRIEYEAKDILRKYPYCDYEITPLSPWNYGFADRAFHVTQNPVSDTPFSESRPPISIEASLAPVPWRIKEGFLCMCNEQPESCTASDAARPMRLIPYGCTTLRMTEMPLLDTI